MSHDYQYISDNRLYETATKKMQLQQKFLKKKSKPTGLQLTTSYPVDYRTRKHSYSTSYRRATLLFPLCKENIMN